ncbi:MAG: hypothetical protein H7239_06990 [Flavobacterium sp.]|nr:hypothetical protein [Flavobacterium sp.]
MKKNATMITLILALFVGCALIIGSVYSLFKEKSQAITSEMPELVSTEIAIANKKVEVLEDEVAENKDKFEATETKISKLKSESYTEIVDQNLPIIEISDTDIGEKIELNSDNKKVLKLMYNHQIKFNIVNVGNYSLKEVIFSVKDIYNENKDKKNKKKSNQYNYMGQTFDNEDVGAYNNIEINTLNLKTKKLVYVSNLPSSFGVGDYYFDVIIEWSKGFYQMHVDIEELNGKLKYRYKFYDINGKELDLKSLEKNV